LTFGRQNVIKIRKTLFFLKNYTYHNVDVSSQVYPPPLKINFYCQISKTFGEAINYFSEDFIVPRDTTKTLEE